MFIMPSFKTFDSRTISRELPEVIKLHFITFSFFLCLFLCRPFCLSPGLQTQYQKKVDFLSSRTYENKEALMKKAKVIV